MKQQAAVQTREKNRILPPSSLLPHAAGRDEVRLPSHATPNGPGSRFSHDFSQTTVRPAAPLVGQNYATVACPVFPRRCPFGGACHTCPARVQTKLKVGQPGDKYEQEADRVAEQVMRMPKPGTEQETEISKSSQAASNLQRNPANQAEPTTVPPIVHEVLRSPGQPLDPTTRAFMEPRFGYDFSRVRVHTGARAAESAREVNALAYTGGCDVVFGTGQYAPGTSRGQWLLAHELTHVVQQGVNPQEVFTSHILNNPTPMIQCSNGGAAPRTIADFEGDERYCKDTVWGGLLHRGVCFREVVGACDRGRHVCIDPTSGAVTSDHYDEFSPVERRESNGECNYHAACAYSHIVTEVPAAWGFPYLRRLARWLKEMV